MFMAVNDKAYDRPANPSMCMIIDKKSEQYYGFE